MVLFLELLVLSLECLVLPLGFRIIFFTLHQSILQSIYSLLELADLGLECLLMLVQFIPGFACIIVFLAILVDLVLILLDFVGLLLVLLAHSFLKSLFFLLFSFLKGRNFILILLLYRLLGFFNLGPESCDLLLL